MVGPALSSKARSAASLFSSPGGGIFLHLCWQRWGRDGKAVTGVLWLTLSWDTPGAQVMGVEVTLASSVPPPLSRAAFHPAITVLTRLSEWSSTVLLWILNLLPVNASFSFWEKLLKKMTEALAFIQGWTTPVMRNAGGFRAGRKVGGEDHGSFQIALRLLQGVCQRERQMGGGEKVN